MQSCIDMPEGLLFPPVRPVRHRACCSAMSLSRVMNSLQEIMVLLTGCMDYSSKSLGGEEISYIPVVFKLWKVAWGKKRTLRKMKIIANTASASDFGNLR